MKGVTGLSSRCPHRGGISDTVTSASDQGPLPGAGSEAQRDAPHSVHIHIIHQPASVTNTLSLPAPTWCCVALQLEGM